MRDTIFLSYARAKADAKYRDGLVNQLRAALPEDAGLKLFVDVGIEVGEKWHDEIVTALEQTVVGVFLVSVDLLLSEFVQNEEIPALLAAAEGGLADVACLYARPVECNAGAGARLGKFQALNGPDAPLSSLDAHAREAELRDAARKIIELAIARRKHLQEQAADSVSRTRKHSAAPARLEVELHRQGSGARITYRREGSKLLDDDGWARQPGAKKVGERVFRMLFPGGVWSKLATKVGMAGLEPVGVQAQILIQTDDIDFVHQPWACAASNGLGLTERGWSFALRHPAYDAQRAIVLESRTPVVIGTSAAECDLGASSHGLAATRVFDERWPGSQHTVNRGNSNDTLNALKAVQPGVFYYYGPVTGRGSNLALRFSDGELEVDTLDALWRSSRAPAIVYCNIHGVTRREAAALACMFAQRVPLVIVREFDLNDLEDEHDDPRRTAIRFMAKLLENERVDDPAYLLEGTDEIVFWNGDTLDIGRVKHQSRRRKLARLLLDRLTQRESVTGAVTEMLAAGRTATALIAYGKQGNQLDAFGEQIEQYMFDHHSTVPFRRVPLDLRRLGSLSAQELQAEIAFQLDCEPEHFTEGLRRVATESPETPRSVVLLDMGVRGGSHGPDLKPSELEAWAEFASESLTPACPDDIALLCLLGVEVSRDPNLLKSKADQVALHRLSETFRIRVLPQLDVVPTHELKDFIVQHAGFPERSDATEAAMLLHTKAGGSFERLVEILDRAQDDHWHDVLHDLRRDVRGDEADEASDQEQGF